MTDTKVKININEMRKSLVRSELHSIIIELCEAGFYNKETINNIDLIVQTATKNESLCIKEHLDYLKPFSFWSAGQKEKYDMYLKGILKNIVDYDTIETYVKEYNKIKRELIGYS